MYIIFIRNYKIKLFFAASIILLGVLSFFLINYIFNNNLALKVTINDYLTFSHPLSYEVDNILVNESLNPEAVKVNYLFRKDTAQKFTNFEGLEEGLGFKYPTSFSLAQKQFSGSDILYHIDFNNEKSEAHGFIQVWNLPYSLSDFLQQSEAAAQVNYRQFISKEMHLKDSLGYLWDYSASSEGNESYKGLEVFQKKDQRMYRISYFVPESKWSRFHSNIFWSMVETFKIH